MSALQSFGESMFPSSSGICGTVSFTITGFQSVFSGVPDREVSSQDQRRDGGGFLPEQALTIVAEKNQFSSPPLKGRDVTVGTVGYRIDRLETDEISYTLYLELRVG